MDDLVLKLAIRLEKLALEDEYFVSRKLYPNIDFYPGNVMRALGLPKSMYTVLFAVSRTVGWVAHRNEMISDRDKKIARPRQLLYWSDDPRRVAFSGPDSYGTACRMRLLRKAGNQPTVLSQTVRSRYRAIGQLRAPRH
jgi:hypothetical protein